MTVFGPGGERCRRRISGVIRPFSIGNFKTCGEMTPCNFLVQCEATGVPQLSVHGSRGDQAVFFFRSIWRTIDL